MTMGISSSETARENAPGLLYRLSPYLCLTILSVIIFKVALDDPFITFRYAANILRGNGPVFNPGERVEGYTSPLHLLISTLLLSILPSIGILFKAKIASLLFAVIVIWQTGLIAKKFGLKSHHALAIQLLLSVNISFVAAATNALETTLFAALLAATILKFLDESVLDKGIGSAFLISASILARPEAAGVLACLFAYQAWLALSHRTDAKRFSMWTAVIVLLLLITEFTRHAEYGLYLPNTYYAKHSTLHILAGLRYLFTPFTVVQVGQHLVLPERIFAYILGGIFWSVAVLGALSIRRHPHSTILLIPIIAMSAFIVIVGGDWMPCWRFGVAMLPYLTVLEYKGIIWLVSGMSFSRQKENLGSAMDSRVLACVAAELALMIILSLDSSRHCLASILKHGLIRSTQDSAFFYNEGGQVAGWRSVSNLILTEFPDGSLIAYSEMGYASYENMNVRFIDIRGLTDRTIAKFPRQFKTFNGVFVKNWPISNNPLRQYVLNRKPNAIITFDCITVSPPEYIGSYKLWGLLNGYYPTAIYLPETSVLLNKKLSSSERIRTKKLFS